MMRRLIPLLFLVPLLGAAGQPAEPPVLRLADGEVRLPAAPPAPEASPRGFVYLVALTDGPLDAERWSRIEIAGAELLGYLPDHAYRLRLPAGAVDRVRSLPFVKWLGELPPRHKIAPSVAADAQAVAGPVRLLVLLATGERPDRVTALLHGSAPVSAPAGRDGAWRVTADVPADRLAGTLADLAALPEVEALEQVRPVLPLNQDAVWVHQSFVGPSPQETPVFDQGIFGCDQIISVADTGQDHDACQFAEPVAGPPPVSSCVAPPCPVGSPDLTRRKDIIYYDWSPDATGEGDTCPSLYLTTSGHGTHTSGSAAGDNAPYADCSAHGSANRNSGDGQAPGARLVLLELGDGLEYLNDLGGTIWNIADVAYRSGARIHSFSFGGVCHDLLGQCVPGCELPYDSLARDADLAMWIYPDLLLVNSVGNAGQYCPPPVSVVTPALAKNPLVVGGVEHGTAATAVMPESSRGPVFDGRLRPTVSAQGRAVVSAASDASLFSGNCSTCSLDGTSMSAPTAAGLAALVREYYTAGFYATGARDAGSGFVPSGALVKATLIDGAADISAPGADFDSGFGRLLLASTLAFAGAPFQLRVDDHREGIAAGSVVNHAFDVTAAEPLRATLVWTDYPAELNAAAARVNELKLEVIDPEGNVWFQTLDPGSGAPAQTADPLLPHDTVNTEERIVFAAPAAGRWVVRVLGQDVPWAPQPFALVVRGSLADCPAPEAPAAPTLATPADGQVEISWPAVPGAQAYNVYRSFGACPGGPWISVAAALAGTSHLDTGLSGGVEYSYRVTAASDADGFCESAPSPCASAVPLGDCTLPPEFRGLTGASSAGTPDCAISLIWEAGSSRCPGSLVYNVYRDTTPAFPPGPENLIASCVTGTSYLDSAALVHGAEYHYVVRAEDDTSGHEGPCRGGNADANEEYASASPYGPPELGTWSDDAGDTGTAKLETGPGWHTEATGGDAGPAVYRAASSQLACTDLTSPVLSLAGPAEGPQLTFSTIHDLDYDPGYILFFEGSVGQVEIATGPGFSNWTRVPLTPGYPAYIDAPFYNACPTTQSVGYYFSDVDLVYDTYAASLVNWGGEDVKIRFHLSGDLYFYGGNWWVDDVQVTGAEVPGSCATTAPPPPPVPDGASVPGAPLMVEKSGDGLLLTWDAVRCPPVEVNVYHGAIGDYSTFSGGDCGLPPTGSATLALPDNTWFLVVGTDGAGTDGSWSRDAAGTELIYGGASNACPSITAHLGGGLCP